MEALGYLPIPEPAAQPTEKGYQKVENLWSNPQMLIGSDPASGGMVSIGSKIDINVEGLVRTIARDIQFPERVLGSFGGVKSPCTGRILKHAPNTYSLMEGGNQYA